MLRRIGLATGVAALSLSLLAPATLAGAPTRVYLPIEGPIEIDAGVFCPFPVRIDVLVNTEYGVTFTDDAGNVVRQLVGGRLVVQVTNASTGSTRLANISGPARTTIHADGSTTYELRGNSMPIGPGILMLTTGTVVQEYGADGTFLGQTHAGGTEEDLCVSLA